MSGDGSDYGENAGSPPPEAPSINDGTVTRPAESSPTIGDVARQQADSPVGRAVVEIENLEMHDGQRQPSDSSVHLLTTQEARYIAAGLAVRASLPDGNRALTYLDGERSVADAFGTTREDGGPIDVIIPRSGVPGENGPGNAGIEVKMSKALSDIEQGNRFEIWYATYPGKTIEGLPEGWDKGWDSDQMSPENQARAREIAGRLHDAVQKREAEGLQDKGIAPELVTVVAIPYDQTSQVAQIYQFNRGDIFPDPNQLDWRFSDKGKGLLGIDRDTGKTVINWNQNGGQINAYLNPRDAVRVSDRFSLRLPDGHEQSVPSLIGQIFPGIERPNNS
jgi:hypothetical protein